MLGITRNALRFGSAFVLGAVFFGTVGTATADAVTKFYSGKTVSIVIAAGPGGGHTKYTLLIAPYLKKHMPGNPTFITQNMGGAGGTKAANYLYNRAAQDGSAIGILLSDTPFASRLRTTGVKYIADRFHFLGGAEHTRSAFVVFKSAGVATLADVRKKQVIMGSTGKGSQTYILPALANGMLGTKFKIITGYRGMNGVYHAMDQAEVQGFQAVWSSVAFLRPQWLKNDLVRVLFATSLDPLPNRPNVPLVKDLTSDPMDKKILTLFSGNGILGRAWLAPPGVPRDRIKALRAAFKKMFDDPDLRKNAKKRRMIWTPVPWAGQQKQAQRITAADEALFQRMRSVLGVKK
ncbi:MAG: tripartite tricarboxylate transporter substrate-binding protein [Pseudomonadota bacterium]|nr:tripartite tricarboxylate transporter substrate-binding protein [Pseudomonadota bacterium]